MTGAQIANGERVGSVRAWPTAHPFFTLDRSERLSAAIRLRPESAESINTAEPRRSEAPTALAMGGNSAAKLLPDDPETFSSKVRREGIDYWLDLNIGPIQQLGVYVRRIEVPMSGGYKALVDLTVMVVSQTIVLSSDSVDFGRVSIRDMKNGQVRSARVGLRRTFGTFQISSIQTSHPFLKAEFDTLVPGSNYLIRVSIDPAAALEPGSYDGAIQINTDDANRPKVEIRCKLVAVP